MIHRERILEEKVYRGRRRSKHRKHGYKRLSFRDRMKLRHCHTQLLNEFNKAGYIEPRYVVNELKIPEIFSFQDNFVGSLLFFKQMISTFLLKEEGNVKVDFFFFFFITMATFMIFDLLTKEFRDVIEKYNRGFDVRMMCSRRVKITQPSKLNDKVNKFLISFGYCTYEDVDNVNGDESFLSMNLIKGKWRTYTENMKGLAAKHIVNFVNETLKRINKQIKPEVKNYIDGFITEILSNAEEHSSNKIEWYVNGISFLESQCGYDIIELNLSIMNVGKTMFEGFEETKEQNSDNYSIVDKAYSKHMNLHNSHHFTKEGMFMMYMLNDGISRLKYEDDARGNGTMKFLENFILLGSFGLKVKEFNPKLHIISGSTVLTCDGDTRPYAYNNGGKILSLNKSQNPNELPDEEYLRSFDGKFPGTILECKIYFNKDFFENGN